MARPTRAVIDLQALRHNYQLAASLAPNSQTMAIVKANAYGHGAVAVAKALQPLVPALGVACIEEALELRAGGISKPILLLEGPFSPDEVLEAAQQDFWLMACQLEQVAAIVDARPDKPITVWLKVDTGMHRLGVTPAEAGSAYRQLRACSHVRPELVLATHLASADDMDNPFTRYQLSTFDNVLEHIEADSVATSIANSAAVLNWPDSYGSWNRPGYMLYGSTPLLDPHAQADRLRPVMQLQSAIIALHQVPAGEAVGYGGSWVAARPSVIATVAIGYGDGYPRNARSGTPVLVNGQRVALAGRVSMDMITVDVTDLADVAIGDPVELWGTALPVNEVAAWADTIGYELLTRMPLRTPRIYRD